MICKITGCLDIFFDMSSFIYLTLFSTLIKRKVIKPTSDFTKTIIVVHGVAIGIPLIFTLVMYFTFDIGVTVSFAFEKDFI